MKAVLTTILKIIAIVFVIALLWPAGSSDPCRSANSVMGNTC